MSRESNPRVTWLMAVKNGLPFLPQTLESIEAQTYKNWEVLIWDNGSTDGTRDLLKAWVPSRLPGRIVLDQPFVNLAESLAAAVMACTTELIARIDADDICLTDRLEKQVAFLQDYPEVDVLGGNLMKIDAEGRKLGMIQPYPGTDIGIKLELLRRNPIGNPSVLFKRSAVLRAGNYRNVGPVNCEDYDLWLRMVPTSVFGNLDSVLVLYRIHEGSTTQQEIKANRLTAQIERLLSENADKAFGLTGAEALLLRNHTYDDPLELFGKLARKICPETLDWKLDSKMVAFFLSITGRGPGAPWPKPYGFSERIRRKLKSIVSHHVGSSVQSDPKTSWIHAQKALSVSVHPSLEVKGGGTLHRRVGLGRGVCLEAEVTFWLPREAPDGYLKVGDDVFIGRNTYLGVYEPIFIGDNTMVGAYCYLISANHRYSSRDIPMSKQGFDGEAIYIEADVWLGTHVTVLPGVRIGKGSIVGAGSVVTKDIPPYEVWGGAPARKLKNRP